MADDVTYREPSIEDGAEVWKMVDETAALDANSSYTYFMIFRNFAATSVVAEAAGEIAGMLTAYPLPDDPQRLFVWQVNVGEGFQGRGIARGMLAEVMKREPCAAVRYIETTIEPGNEASEALFRRVAEQYNAEIRTTDVYRDELFPDAEHKIERLFVIGPITRTHNRVRIRAEDGGYRLYAELDGSEVPAFTPANPWFSSLQDAMRAGDEVCEAHAAGEVVIEDAAASL